MITKYFSEKTHEEYSSEKECLEAEKQWDKDHAAELAERKSAAEDADKLKKLYEEVRTASKRYNDAVNDFIKKHRNYHLTISSPDFFASFMDLSNWF